MATRGEREDDFDRDLWVAVWRGDIDAARAVLDRGFAAAEGEDRQRRLLEAKREVRRIQAAAGDGATRIAA